ncbi:MAG: FecR domain-containing protein [Chthoniobacteraceae bacterium]
MPSEQEISDYLGGVMSGAELAAFEERILSEPEGAAEVVSQRQMDLALGSLLKGSEGVEAAILASVRGLSAAEAVDQVLAETVQKPLFKKTPEPVRRQQAVRATPAVQVMKKPRGSWWTTAQALSSVGAAVAAIVLVIVYGPAWLNRQPTVVTTTQPDIVVAKVRDDYGARWGARQRPLRWGDELHRESLVLDSGVVELAFSNGTTLVAEGPARIDLADAGHVILHRGKVSAHVPASAIGFTIDTTAGRIVDRGTRFGVKASPAGVVETHVFEGLVDVTPEARFRSAMKPLKRDMAVRLDPQTAALAPVTSEVREFPQPGKIVAEPLVEGGFEKLATVGTDGMPIVPAVWSGDSCSIIGPHLGVRPRDGSRMLAFLQTGEGAVDRTETDVWTASEQWQFVDLAPYKEAIANGVTAELSAFFNRVGGELEADQFVVVLAAYKGSPEDVKTQWWGHRPELALAYSQDTITTDEDPATWERDEVRFEVPAGADYLLVSIAAARSNPAEKISGHFADSIALRLVIPPSFAVHSQR